MRLPLLRAAVMRRRGPIVLVRDTFTRSDNASSLGSAETGQAWTALAGTWGISGNRAYLVGAGASAGLEAALVNSGVSNGAVSCLLTWATGSAGGVYARHSNQAAGNFNAFCARLAGAGLVLFRVDAGVFTSIGSYAFTPTNGVTYRIELRMQGTALSVSLDGVQRITATDTAHGSNVHHGLRSSAPTAGEFFDDFRVTR